MLLYMPPLFYGSGNLFGQSIHLGGLHLDMMAEIKVAGIIERHKVYVCMRHVNAHYGNTYLDAWTDLLQTLCDTTAETMQRNKQLVVKVKDIVNFFLGDAQHVSFDNRVDIKESETLVGLCHLVAGNLA